MSQPQPQSQHLRISVITAAFNAVDTIGRTLDSVAAQTHPAVEHVVIDGGSTDGTVAVVQQRGAHVAHWVSEADRGIYDAMNKGMALASGDVFCFLNADDCYASNTILAEVAQQMEAQRLDALIADVAFFHPGRPERVVRRYRSDRFRPERLAWGWMPAHPAVFLRRAVVERVGAFRTDYRIAGDYEYMVRVFADRAVRYAHWPQVAVHMLTGGASTAGWRATWLLNREVLRACRENGVDTHVLKILSKYPAKLLELFQS